MKHSLFIGMLAIACWTATNCFAQSTEGTDFWVTMMRADSNNPTNLSLTVSAKNATSVTVANPFTGYTTTFNVAANGIYHLENLNANDCYVGANADVESVSRHALHVTSDEPISLIAANYRDKSFDVAAVLPTAAVRSEYRIMCYTPSAHSDASQGSHFAIVATEDNTVVDITPTVKTMRHLAGITYQTDTLQKGEVYYVWTGNGSGDNFDLSGTAVQAQDNKKIAVFNGNSHTNIPINIRDRDQIYSQAMPIQYWGTQFAIMSSKTTIDEQTGTWERIDKIRVMALTDGTEIYIDGNLVHTIDFATNPKGIYEFDFGAKDQMTNYSGDGHPYFEGASHYLETSCPAAVHQFFTSNRYDHNSGKYCNGDPSELWVNPIEQNIAEITFATFQTAQVKNHFLNIVTKNSNVASVTLDGASISSQFAPLTGNNAYQFARMTINNGTHTLRADSGFIANVYGFGEKESYAFPAGAYTKDLTSAIVINGDTFSIEKQSTLCGYDTIHFECTLNYAPQAVKWGFGDGTDTTIINTTNSNSITVDHFYPLNGNYPAYAKIVREHDITCYGSADVDSIPINVNIGRYEFSIGTPDIPCPEDGKQYVGKIPYSNPAQINLHGGNVTIEFDATAQHDGFEQSDLVVSEDHFVIVIPETAKPDTQYGIHMQIESSCGGTDTVMYFMLNYDKDIITQRYNNVLGLLTAPFEGKQLSDFQWYRTSDSTAIEGQVSSNLNMYDLPFDSYKNDTYYVCFTVGKGTANEATSCACAKAFSQNDLPYSFGEQFTLSVTAEPMGDNVFVNAVWDQAQEDIEATAQWLNIQGKALGEAIVLPNGGRTITMPKEQGMYLLRVVIGKQTRTFKFIRY